MPKSPQREEKTRLDADAWIEAALHAIVANGVQAVAVEPLARKLAVTKGSFYWHFADRDALLSAMVDRWAARTDELIAEAESIPDPRVRLETLIHGAHRSELGVRTVRAMGALADHETVGRRVKAVARRRHAFLSECFVALGLETTRAESAARLVHAAFLGVGELEALGVGFRTASDRKSYLEELIAAVSRIAVARR